MRIGDMIAPRDPFPAGQHLAICYACVNLGLQEEKFKGVAKIMGKFVLIWEFPKLLIEVEDEWEKKMLPRAMSINYTASASDKAKFRKHLMGWLGKSFSGSEMKEYDPETLVGQACLIQIVHEDVDGVTRDRVATITPVPEGMPVPALVNPTLIYDFNYETQTWPPFPKNMPDWIRNKILFSKQMQAQRLREEGKSPEETKDVAQTRPSEQITKPERQEVHDSTPTRVDAPATFETTEVHNTNTSGPDLSANKVQF